MRCLGGEDGKIEASLQRPKTHYLRIFSEGRRHAVLALVRGEGGG